MNTQETLKSDAIRFVNTVVKAKKMLLKQYESLDDAGICAIGFGKDWVSETAKTIQVSGVIKLAQLIGVNISQIDWPGNDYCKSNNMEVYFIYKGIKFFELIDKLDLIKTVDNIEFMEER